MVYIGRRILNYNGISYPKKAKEEYVIEKDKME